MNRKRYTMVFVVLFLFFVQAAVASELVIGTMGEPSIDPHLFYVSANIAYSSHIFGTLTTLDDNMRLQPNLAASWKATDSTTWEFKLREGVRFHDGSDFTAEDVVFSFKRTQNVAGGRFHIKEISEIRISDPHTLIMKTSIPFSRLPTAISHVFIVSRKSSEKADTADFTSGKAAIGTGPYKFAEYVSGNRLVLQRNENYWGDKPAFEKVTFKIFTNDDNRVAALLGGVADIIEFVPPSALQILEKKNFKLFKCASDRVIFIDLNTIRDNPPNITDKDGKPIDKNPLKDIRVRKAISKAIYRDAIVQQVMKGLAFPASQLIPEGWYSYNPDLKVEPYDPDGAKKLLAEAGYPDGFGLTIHGTNDRYINDVEICEAIARMLAKIGLKTKVETMSASVYFEKLRPPRYEFDFCLRGWGNATAGESSEGLMSFVQSYNPEKKTGRSNVGYSNPRFDEILEKAVATVDSTVREKLLRESMAIVINDYGVIPLHAQSVVVASRKGIVYTPRADEHTLAMSARPE